MDEKDRFLVNNSDLESAASPPSYSNLRIRRRYSLLILLSVISFGIIAIVLIRAVGQDQLTSKRTGFIDVAFVFPEVVPEAHKGQIFDAEVAEEQKPSIHINRPVGLPAITAKQVAAYHSSFALGPPIVWVNSDNYPDGYMVSNKEDKIILSHVEYGNETILADLSVIKNEKGEEISIVDWSLSHDVTKLLLVSNLVSGWRHSYFGDYYLYDIATKSTKLLPLHKSTKPLPNSLGAGMISFVLWSPVGHSVAWVRDNDLFLTADGKEYQITTDGSPNIINGIADWVYEEEVLASKTASWFSNDGTKLAFVKFDDSKVLEFELQYVAKFGEESYPEHVKVKYPKAGTPNPKIEFHIAEMTDGEMTPTRIDFGPKSFAEDDSIITQVNWVDANSRLLVRIMNRVQNKQKLFLITKTAPTWTVKLLRDEATEDKAWINGMQPLYLVPQSGTGQENPTYVELMENHEGYAHLALFSLYDHTPVWLTKGPWEVVEINSIDVLNQKIYFTSTEIESTQRHLYSVTLDGKQKEFVIPSNVRARPALIVSYKQAQKELGVEGYYSAYFSPQSKYYQLSYLGPDVPWQTIEKTGQSQKLKVFEQTDSQQAKLYKTYTMPKLEYLTIKNDLGEDMNAKFIYPPLFDPKKKYPLLMEVYGGPNSQKVNKKYNIDLMYEIATLDIVVLLVDGRGTGFKGRKFRAAVSENLGLHEVEDYIAAAKWAGTQSFIDSKRIGIWGWSFGGYTTSKVVEANSGVFLLGIAVAPVTDWRYYDSVYTERFMKTPSENHLGYERSAVSKMDGFKHTKFLLMHGTADDNVHLQNSLDLVWKLTGAGVTTYSMQYYTDSDHSINTHGARSALNLKIRTYLCDEFKLPCFSSQ